MMTKTIAAGWAEVVGEGWESPIMLTPTENKPNMKARASWRNR